MNSLADLLDSLDKLINQGNLTQSDKLLQQALASLTKAPFEAHFYQPILSFADELQQRALGYSQPWLLQQAIDFYSFGISKSSGTANIDIHRRFVTHCANALQRLAAIEGDEAMLERSIVLYSQVLKTYQTQPDSATEAMILTNRASSLEALSALSVAKDHLNMAIEDYQLARKLTDKSILPAQWILATLGIAKALRIKGIRAGEVQQLHNAVSLYLEVLSEPQIEQMPKDKALAYDGVGVAYFRIGEMCNDMEAMNKAFTSHHKANAIYQVNGPKIDFARSFINCANVAARLGEYTGAVADFNQAIDNYHKALDFIDVNNYPVDWSIIQTGLGNANVRLGEMIGDIAMLSKGRDHLDSAGTIYDNNRKSAEWMINQINIGIVEQILANLSCSVDDSKQAISRFNHVLDSFPAHSFGAEKLRVICAKAVSEKKLADLLSEPKYYLAAISSYQQVLQVITFEHHPNEYLRISSNLANALSCYGELTLDIASLKEAVKIFDHGIAAYQDKANIGWATTELNRAIVLANLGELTSDINRFKQAQKSYREVLVFFNQKEHLFHWIGVKNSLGSLTTRMARLTNCFDTLVAGIEHMCQAHEQMGSIEHDFLANAIIVNLVSALEDAYDHSSELKWLEQAYTLCANGVKGYSLEQTPLYYLGLSKQLGKLLLRLERFDEAFRILKPLLAATVDVALGEPHRRRSDFLFRRMAGLNDMLAKCLMAKNNDTEALITLDSGRAMSMALSFNDRSKNQELTTLVCQWRLMQQQLDALKAAPIPKQSEAQQHYFDNQYSAYQQVEKHYAKIQRLRHELNLTDGSGLLLTRLRQALPAGGCYAVPSITDSGGKILLLLKDKIAIEVIDLPDFNSKRLRTLMGDKSLIGPPEPHCWSVAYQQYKQDLSNNNGRLTEQIAQNWLNSLSLMLAQLAELMMQPLHQALQQLGVQQGCHVVLSPPGILAVLPLMACPVSSTQQFLDYWCISYTPNAAAYINASAQRSRRAKLKTIACSVTNPTEDLGVSSSPLTALYPHSEHIDLAAKQATKAALELALTRATEFCFYCHGHWSNADPLNSWLELTDGDVLTASDIKRMSNIHARLAFLGACDVGTIDLRNAPDEFIGVAASFIEAGFPAVVAPLWPVPAGTTLTMAQLFFKFYQQNHCASSALRQAQLAIKNEQFNSNQIGDSQSLGFRRKQPFDNLPETTYSKLASLGFVCYGV